MGCNSETGEHCFAYGAVFGFNPENQSLLMKGHASVREVGEVSIPKSLEGSSTAEVLQNIYDIADGREVDPGETNGQGPVPRGAYILSIHDGDEHLLSKTFQAAFSF